MGPEHMVQIARLGVEAREAKRLARLKTVTLLPFDCEESVMGNLEIICKRAVTGDLSGSQAGAAVRACEVWVKTQSLKQSRDTIQQLEKQIRELETQLKRRRIA